MHSDSLTDPVRQIDLLFASKTPFVWETEKRFQELRLEHSNLVRGGQRNRKVADIEEKTEATETAETADTVKT